MQAPLSISLLYGSQSVDEILMLQDLTKIKDKIKIHFTVDRPPNPQGFLLGVMDEQKIVDCLPPPSEETLILCCGPAKMNNVVREVLSKYNYKWTHFF